MGNVSVAAVRAVLPPVVEKLASGPTTEVIQTRKFEVALMRGSRDVVRHLPLFSNRHVVVWLSPAEGSLSSSQADAACQAVLDVLGVENHGDNEDPRLAGRQALAAMRATPAQVRVAVIQLFDEWERVKYFRAGWKQPIELGGRGLSGDGQQQYDEGGDATVHKGSRLFFPGSLELEGQHAQADSLARVWFGGKASLLYEALVNHWKTKKSDKALEKLALAACGDRPGSPIQGLGLVTGI